MIISIDLDGVLCDFMGRVRSTPSYQDVTSTQDMDKDRWENLWVALASTENLWETLDPIEENVEALRSFLSHNSNHVVYFVTARQGTAGRNVSVQCARWLREHNVYPHFNYTAVVPVSGADVKPYVMIDLDIQYSVDDVAKTVDSCNDLKDHKAFLLDQPYNRGINLPRVSNLAEFFERIK